MAVEEALRSTCEQNIGMRRIDDGTCEAHTFNGLGQRIYGVIRAGTGVFDRQPGNTCLNTSLNVHGQRVDVFGIAGMGVGVHRKIGRGDVS